MRECFPRFDPSLGDRLTLYTFACQALLLTMMSALIYYVCRNSFYDSFDAGLLTTANALASAVELEEDEDDETHEYGEVEFEYNHSALLDLQLDSLPDLFALVLDTDTVFAKSPRLETVPLQALDPESGDLYFNYKINGNPYRGIIYAGFTVSHESDLPSQAFRILYLRSLGKVNGELKSLAVAICIITLLCLVASVLAARITANTGLKPVEHLAEDIRAVTEDKLSERISISGLPLELLPIGNAMNTLLTRIQYAFENEKRFSSDAAHELRTPIATLKSGIQAAQLADDYGPDAMLLLGELLNEVDRLENLCSSLLLMTKGDNDNSLLLLGEVIDEIESCLSAIGEKYPDGNYTIKTKLGPLSGGKETFVHTSALATFQIITNLIENSIRYAGSPVEISLSGELGAQSKELILIVSDDGVGIPRDKAPFIFERFYRVDKSRARVQGGYGLGLAICRTLARNFGGDITYQPNLPQGATFIWNLKVADSYT